MNGGDFFNNKQIFYNFKLLNFLDKNLDGISYSYITFLEKRLEVSSKYYINDYQNSRWYVLFKLLYTIIPENKNLKKQRLINIYFLDLIFSYRGYRHSFGLPVRGQRTWVNANSVFKSNVIMRNYKMSVFKKSITHTSQRDINNAFYLEQLNFLWKNQWESEWSIFKKKRIVDLKKSRGFIKFDINTLVRINPNVRDKKKQNIFSIGFDKGFTKKVLKNNVKLMLKKSSKK